MPRMARVKDSTVNSWYHVCARVAGDRDDRPLLEPAARDRLVRILRHYTAVYFCRVAGFCVMGNHYHLVVGFDAEREVPRDELWRRARRMYPDGRDRARLEAWSEDDWERYRRRLFDVSELMRNVQSAFARWYNRTHGRRGHFWAERFRSTLLEEGRALVECLLYVELNPVRAGLVERPEAWKGSSAALRVAGLDGWLMSLEELHGVPSAERARVEHRYLLYHRGAVPTRPGQAAIPHEVLEREVARGFGGGGAYRVRLRYFVDGLVVGSEAFVRAHLERLLAAGRYRRRRDPIPQLGGAHHSLREQRSTAAVF